MTDSEAESPRVNEEDRPEGLLSIGVAFRLASRDGSLTVSVKDLKIQVNTLPRLLQNRQEPCPRNRHLERIRRPKHIRIAAGGVACLWIAFHMLDGTVPVIPPGRPALSLVSASGVESTSDITSRCVLRARTPRPSTGADARCGPGLDLPRCGRSSVELRLVPPVRCSGPRTRQ